MKKKKKQDNVQIWVRINGDFYYFKPLNMEIKTEVINPNDLISPIRHNITWIDDTAKKIFEKHCIDRRRKSPESIIKGLVEKYELDEDR